MLLVVGAVGVAIGILENAAAVDERAVGGAEKVTVGGSLEIGDLGEVVNSALGAGTLRFGVILALTMSGEAVVVVSKVIHLLLGPEEGFESLAILFVGRHLALTESGVDVVQIKDWDFAKRHGIGTGGPSCPLSTAATSLSLITEVYTRAPGRHDQAI